MAESGRGIDLPRRRAQWLGLCLFSCNFVGTVRLCVRGYDSQILDNTQPTYDTDDNGKSLSSCKTQQKPGHEYRREDY